VENADCFATEATSLRDEGGSRSAEINPQKAESLLAATLPLFTFYSTQGQIWPPPSRGGL